MSDFFSDKEVPRYIYICGVSGIVSLTLSLILFIVFYTVYHEKQDYSITQVKKLSAGGQGTSLGSFILAIIGIILSCFIIYGHAIKQRKDPQIIFGPTSYVEFPDTNEIVKIEEESRIYTGEKDLKPEQSLKPNRFNTNFL